MVRPERARTIILLVILLAVIIAGVLLLVHYVRTDGSGTGDGSAAGVVISEVVTSNSTLRDDYDTMPDWIELHNTTDRRVDLSGWGLSDRAGEPYRFAFPHGTAIDAGGYLLVWAPGAESEQREGLRTPFALSKNGETVVLVNASGALVHSLTVPALPENMSWGVKPDGEYAYFSSPTPGEANTTPSSDTPEQDVTPVDTSIKLNEVMIGNDYSIMDADGDHSDWIEIANTGSARVNLAGYALSDDPNNRMKWLLPDVNIEPGGFVVVFLSGKDRTGGELHTSFRIGSDEDRVLLSEPAGALIDVLVLAAELPGNVSYGRGIDDIDEYLYYPTPTPGYPNDTKGFTVIDEALRMDGVYISEVKATDVARSGNADWIELYNSTDSDIALAGWGLTDSKNDPFRFTFPDETTIAADGYLVVELGRNAKGALRADLGVSSAGETVYLYNERGVAVDSFTSGYQRAGVTSGRAAGDDSGARVFFTTSTKGAANDTAALVSYAAAPHFSQRGGYYDGPVTIEITSDAPGAVIHYTTDGSKPDSSSPICEGPVTIDATATLRAVAYEDGRLASDVTSATYLLEIPHDIPVVCIASADDGLFGYKNGIFADGPGYTEELPHTGANYWKDWEREISFEFYEADGTLGVQFDAGLQVHGQYSRAEAQKSMAVHLRGAYGQSEVTYPFFRDYDVTTFSSFLLRTSGQDWGSTKIRDAFFAQAVKGVMDLDYMEYRPVALYINGRYWGLYNMREKVNEDYISNHYGIDGHDIDMIKGNNDAKTGDNDAFQALRSYMKSHNLSNQEVYDYVASQVDIDNFIDYAIVETYFTNTDTGNIKFWKERNDTGKWRWVLFDLDWGLYPTTYQWNSIAAFFNSNGHGYNNNFYTHMQMGLIQNEGFRDKLYERYAFHINNTFAPDRLCDLIDQMAAEIRTEMERHCARWKRPSSVEQWERSIEGLKERVREKPALAIKHLQSRFNIPQARMDELFPDR